MDKKEKIFESAHVLFLEKGIEKTSVREITEKAQVAKGTFYLYFENKQDLISAFIHHQLVSVINQTIQNIDKTDSDWFHQFFDQLIQVCAGSADMLHFLEKNMDSKELLAAVAFNHDQTEEELKDSKIVIEMEKMGYEKEDAVIRMMLGMRIVLSACYDSLILKNSFTLDKIRPYILSLTDHLFSEVK